MDNRLVLALAIQSNPGVYACFVGSGLSAASGIPTGNAILRDVIDRLAAMSSIPPGMEADTWYETEFGEEPTYSGVFSKLGYTPAETNALLTGYFDPTEFVVDGKASKRPTRAHHAIAELVARGYFKVLLTTNFDRLLETALASQGLNAKVISSDSDVQSMIPLTHSGPVVIKLNGDYLDLRMKNTAAELRSLSIDFDGLLKEVFSNYGLLICGWSGEVDPAICRSIEQYAGKKYSAFWANPQFSDAATTLIERANVRKINIMDADSFFNDLVQKIDALNTMLSPVTLDAKVAKATAKRLQSANDRIGLADHVNKLVEECYSMIVRPLADAAGVKSHPEYVNKYEQQIGTLLEVFVSGVYWSSPETIEVWLNALRRIANSRHPNIPDTLYDFELYPAVLLYYAGAVALTSNDSYDKLATLSNRKLVRDSRLNDPGILYTPLDILHPRMIERRWLRLSKRVMDNVRPYLKDIIPDENDYLIAFHKTEYLLSIASLLRTGALEQIPYGRFAVDQLPHELANHIESELEAQGVEWPPLASGLFGAATLDDVKSAIHRLNASLPEIYKRQSIGVAHA